MIVVYIYILFYSFFKTFFHRKRNQIAVRSRFDESVRRFRERSLHARKRKRFPSFCVTFIHENHPSDIIIINMFSISATAVVVSASSANKVRFCFCRSLSVFLFAFFAFFARGLKVCGGCVSLSLSQIDFSPSENSNPRWQKFGSSSRNLSHPLYLFSLHAAFLRDGDSGGFLFLLSSFLSSRNEAERDDILPPSAWRDQRV